MNPTPTKALQTENRGSLLRRKRFRVLCLLIFGSVDQLNHCPSGFKYSSAASARSHRGTSQVFPEMEADLIVSETRELDIMG